MSTNNTLQTWTKKDEQMFATCKKGIVECQKAADGLAARIAGILYTVDKHSLYQIDGFTGVGKWAEDKYGIKKSTTSEAIKVFKRFGSEKDGVAKIIDKNNYDKFAFSALVAIAPMPDEDIVREKITPEMTRTEIRNAVAMYNTRQELMDKQKELVSTLGLDKTLDSKTWLEEYKTRKQALEDKQEQTEEQEISSAAEQEQTEEQETGSAVEQEQNGEEQEQEETNNEFPSGANNKGIYLSDFMDKDGKMKKGYTRTKFLAELWEVIVQCNAIDKDIHLYAPCWTRTEK